MSRIKVESDTDKNLMPSTSKKSKSSERDVEISSFNRILHFVEGIKYNLNDHLYGFCLFK